LNYIPPRITLNDEFGQSIQDVITTYKPVKVLDVGASSGEGTTRILNENGLQIWSIEVDPDRIAKFNEHYNGNDKVRLITEGSVDVFMTQEQLMWYYRAYPHWNCWKSLGYKEMKVWLTNNQRYSGQGVEKALKDSGGFDMVILDGSPFTGVAELMKVYGTRIIVMDDVDDVKNYTPFLMMGNDYKLLKRSYYGNGYAIFIKNEQKG